MKQLRFFDVPLEEWNRLKEIREAKECLKVALKHRNELRVFLRDYEHLYKWGKAYFKREKIIDIKAVRGHKKIEGNVVSIQESLEDIEEYIIYTEYWLEENSNQ